MACKYIYKGITYNSKEEFISQVINPQFLSNKKVRRVMEVQSDLFQKGRDKKDLITNRGELGEDLLLDKSQFEIVNFENIPIKESNKGFGIKQFGYSNVFEDDIYYYTEIDNNVFGRIRKSEFEDKNSKENQFLQLS